VTPVTTMTGDAEDGDDDVYYLYILYTYNRTIQNHTTHTTLYQTPLGGIRI